MSTQCPHCKTGELELAPGDFPYSIDHWICSDCDSTYPEWEFNPAKTESEVIAIHKVLGGLNDIELEKMGIRGEEREELRNIFYELNFIPDKNEE